MFSTVDGKTTGKCWLERTWSHTWSRTGAHTRSGQMWFVLGSPESLQGMRSPDLPGEGCTVPLMKNLSLISTQLLVLSSSSTKMCLTLLSLWLPSKQLTCYAPLKLKSPLLQRRRSPRKWSCPHRLSEAVTTRPPAAALRSSLEVGKELHVLEVTDHQSSQPLCFLFQPPTPQKALSPLHRLADGKRQKHGKEVAGSPRSSSMLSEGSEDPNSSWRW